MRTDSRPCTGRPHSTREDAVELLLANKADMNIKVVQYGWTPLRLAVIHGHMAAAEALLDGGSDPNVKDDENIPLLHQAVIRGKKEMVELLLDKKADLNAKDSEGETALDEAVEQGNKEIIELLRPAMARRENDHLRVANLSVERDVQDGADGQTHFCVTMP